MRLLCYVGVTPDSKEDRATKESPRKMVVKPSSPKEPSSPRVPEHRLVTASTPRQKVKGKGDQAVSRVEREVRNPSSKVSYLTARKVLV